MTDLVKYQREKEQFELVCREAGQLSIVQNASAAFEAVMVVNSLRNLLTDEIVNDVFMPLMNTKIGFLTDRNGRPNSQGQIKPLYDVRIVKDAIIDAVCFGLVPAFNQFNIIAEKMYPTKEGYTARLKSIGVKYFLNIGLDKNTNQQFAEIPCDINYEFNGEKNRFAIVATVKKDTYSSADQLKGKAERRAKKVLFEYITGIDLGDADEDSSATIISSTPTSQRTSNISAKIDQKKNAQEVKAIETIKVKDIAEAKKLLADSFGVSEDFLTPDKIDETALSFNIKLEYQNKTLL